MQLLIVDGCAERIVKPAGRYAEIAAASRAMGFNIEDHDYEKIDALLEGPSDPSDTLINGYLPCEDRKVSWMN
jgi:hypothetical protein